MSVKDSESRPVRREKPPAEFFFGRSWLNIGSIVAFYHVIQRVGNFGSTNGAHSKLYLKNAGGYLWLELNVMVPQNCCSLVMNYFQIVDSKRSVKVLTTGLQG